MGDRSDQQLLEDAWLAFRLSTFCRGHGQRYMSLDLLLDALLLLLNIPAVIASAQDSINSLLSPELEIHILEPSCSAMESLPSPDWPSSHGLPRTRTAAGHVARLG